MARAAQCGYCCFNRVAYEYGRFAFDGSPLSPESVQTRYYPVYEIVSFRNLDDEYSFIEGEEGDFVGSLSFEEYDECKQQDVVAKTMKMDNLLLLQDPVGMSQFFHNLLQSSFFQYPCLLLMFIPPWGSYGKALETLRMLDGIDFMVVVPYIYQFVPFPLSPSTDEDSAVRLVFEVLGDSFAIHSYHPSDPLHPVYKHNLSLSRDTFVTLLYNAVDKQAVACSLPPIPTQSDAALKASLSLLFSCWKKESARSISWDTPTGTMMVSFPSDIVWETKQRMLFTLLDEVFASLRITSFSRFLVVGNGDLASFIREAFPHYKHAPQLQTLDTHAVLCSNLSRLMIAHMSQLSPFSLNFLIPCFQATLSNAVHRTAHSMGWGKCIAIGGQTTLQSVEKENSVELCLQRSGTRSLCVMLTVSRCRHDLFGPRVSGFLSGGMPPSFATTGDMTKEGESHASVGMLEEGLLSGPCVVAYCDKDVVFEGEMVRGERSGAGRVFHRGQLAFEGEFARDRMAGRGAWFRPDGTQLVGHFVDGELHGVGCGAVACEETDCGAFAHGEWEGPHLVAQRAGVSAGVVSAEQWDGPVVRSLADGGVVVSHYEEGVLKDALWCDARGDVVDARVAAQRCVQVRYGAEGKRVSIGSHGAAPHSVRQCDDLWLLGDGGEDACYDACRDACRDACHDTCQGVCRDACDANSQASLALLASLASLDTLVPTASGMQGSQGSPGENEWVMKVEAGMENGEEVCMRHGEEASKVICGADLEQCESYTIHRGARFENHPTWKIRWKKGGEKGCGEGVLVTEEEAVVYEGAFEDYMFCGSGSQFYRSGETEFEGTFSESVLNGNGRWLFPNGCLHYDGMWKDGKMEGKGLLYKPVNLEYTNAEFRSFLRKKGASSPFISVARGYDIYSLEKSVNGCGVCLIAGMENGAILER